MEKKRLFEKTESGKTCCSRLMEREEAMEMVRQLGYCGYEI